MDDPRTPSRLDLAEEVERLIHERTNGMVRGLRVEIFGEEVVLSGRVPTYYAKQLAQHAALDAALHCELTNAIEVS